MEAEESESFSYPMLLPSDGLYPEDDDDADMDQDKNPEENVMNEKEDEDVDAVDEKSGEEDVEMDTMEDENENDEDTEQTSEKKETEETPKENPLEKLKQKASTASFYDVVPTLAIPMATSINAFAFTSDLKWLFTGGEDGYIRKYDFFPSINGDLSLTVAQRHPFVDTVTKAGILLNYWENAYDGNKPSSVYSLAAHSRGLWVLSGVNNGDIILYSTRHQEGYPVTSLKKHTAPVSCLALHGSEKKVLSGSWDKMVYYWDLNTGDAISTYNCESGQISNIVYRPSGAVNPWGSESDDMRSLFGTPASSSSYDALFDEEVEKAIEEETKSVQANEENETEKPSQTESTTNNDNIKAPSESSSEESNIFLTTSIDGVMNVWDHRMVDSVLKYPVPKGVPPWAMSACWSPDGNNIYIGRRNGIVEEYNIHSGKEPVRSLKMPLDSGPVSNVYSMPNGRHLVISSFDNIRLYDLQSKAGIGFLIIPGHHGGLVSSLYVDTSCQFMFSASGNRGWQGTTTEVFLGYQIMTS
ncbi:SAGA complex subunit Spt8 [Schizosaccharomyces pombe]|uniref:SAGA complex subunit Spt8 n=1 Tax=Schizosaccharomyces pombe (strain 972 / ATCC 24843) TaxID=284812 RepID=SPT8_SCHPO|nr:SAGA complex subunit Spt8 [Schizosaccharomyces pombe]O60097.1 RecName: Full=Transcription factor spt8 [Schizosaccharomyces pombe 972h-]CAA18434.1 SAGA complex subunit Spt8 [Schizosaccharomyces pombe]|eukprot:NP_595920.1 SAGA complex subunit Spt8 [Schizosaccharomyces pombe]